MSQHKILISNSSFKQWPDSHDFLIMNNTNSIDFSFILILIPSDWPYDHFIETAQVALENREAIKFSHLITPGQSIGLIKTFPEWNLLVITTPFVDDNVIHKIDKKPEGSLRLANYERPLQSLYFILNQASTQTKPFKQ